MKIQRLAAVTMVLAACLVGAGCQGAGGGGGGGSTGADNAGGGSAKKVPQDARRVADRQPLPPGPPPIDRRVRSRGPAGDEYRRHRSPRGGRPALVHRGWCSLHGGGAAVGALRRIGPDPASSA